MSPSSRILIPCFAALLFAAPALPARAAASAAPLGGVPRDVAPVAALPFASDELVLDFLRTASVTAARPLATGISRSVKLTLERDGVVAHGIFRTVDHTLGNQRGRLADRDSYRHELAAYTVARLLGIDRVPPVVERTIDGRRGSLQLWIEDAVTEATVLTTDRRFISPARRVGWKRAQALFDRLIYNFDRHHGNTIYDQAGELWYIDHTRSFKSLPLLPPAPAVAAVDQQLLDRLRALDAGSLRRALRHNLDPAQIAALLVRRRALLREIDRAIAARGEQAVVVARRSVNPHLASS